MPLPDPGAAAAANAMTRFGVRDCIRFRSLKSVLQPTRGLSRRRRPRVRQHAYLRRLRVLRWPRPPRAGPAGPFTASPIGPLAPATISATTWSRSPSSIFRKVFRERRRRSAASTFKGWRAERSVGRVGGPRSHGSQWRMDPFRRFPATATYRGVICRTVASQQVVMRAMQ